MPIPNYLSDNSRGRFPWSGRSVKECNCADPFSLSCPYHNSESGQRLGDAEQEKRILGAHDNGDNQVEARIIYIGW